MSEIEELKAEIRRLQGILDDNEISYELEAFGPPDRPQFGPPTLMEHVIQLAEAKLVRELGDRLIEEWDRKWSFEDGVLCKTSHGLRIRLPTVMPRVDYTVSR
jgi:hypothetical protein